MGTIIDLRMTLRSGSDAAGEDIHQQALREVNRQLGEGHGDAVELLARRWQQLTGSSERGSLYIVDAISEAEALGAGHGEDDGAEVCFIEVEVTTAPAKQRSTASGRPGKQSTNKAPGMTSKASPYLGRTLSNRRPSNNRVSSAAEDVTGEALELQRPWDDGATGAHQPQHHHHRSRRHQQHRSHEEQQAAEGDAGLEPATQYRPKIQPKPRVPVLSVRKNSAKANSGAEASESLSGPGAEQQVHKDSKRTPRTSEAESEPRSADAEQLGEPAAGGNSKSSVSRKDRAWNDEKASTWFKEKQKRETETRIKTRRREHETILKDLQFIQQRKAKQKDWEHELKLESPQYCYHVRRWTAANTIQRAARQYFLEWTKTHKWRARVTLHPEMLAKEFRDYVHNPGAWKRHKVPMHLLEAWEAAPAP